MVMTVIIFLMNSGSIISYSQTQEKCTTERLWGIDRYKTAISISRNGWESSNVVVLATGEDYPDALCAAPLAKILNAPILLTEGQRLNSQTKAEIVRLGAKSVVIVGGTGVISEIVTKHLESLQIGCTRIWGADRYNTALEVAKYIESIPKEISEISVVTGDDFPDALSISPISAKKEMPILLVPKDTLPQEIKNFIDKKQIKKSFVVGGNDVIGDAVVSQLPNAERIPGTDKYERNIAVINKFADILDFSSTYMATGQNYPDALAGSALAQKISAPIILTADNPSQCTKEFFFSKNGKINKVITLGGQGVITDSLVSIILSNINGTAVQTSAATKYELKYKVDLPDGYSNTSNSKWPLVIHLHGSGREGDDLSMISTPKIPAYSKDGKKLDFIAIAPQCPVGVQWADLVPELNSMLDKIISEYKVDTNRIYLQGTSMGGVGTWYFAAAYPERFAAISPVSSYCDPQLAPNLKDVPVWAYHGANDVVVPLSYEQKMIDALKISGGNVKFTVDPDAGHAMGPMYSAEDIFGWYLTNSLSNRVIQKTVLKYDIVLPNGYETNIQRNYPVLMYLHNKNTGNKDIQSFIDKVKAYNDSSFIVLAPQCPEGIEWTGLQKELNSLLDNICTTYRADTKSIYLTGEGTGGNGTFYIGSMYPERFAAVAPVCGVSDPIFVQNLCNIPVRVYSRKGETPIPEDQKQKNYPRFLTFKSNSTFIVLPDDNNIAEQVYNRELFDWFLQNKSAN